MSLTKKIFITGLLASAVSQVNAETLRIGYASAPTSADPHYSGHTPTAALRAHIFEALVDVDRESKVSPLLAESWQAIDDNTWRFNLRKDVAFSDGSPFTADDVIYSFCRTYHAKKGKRGAGASSVDLISSMEVPDPHTLIIKTNLSQPELPRMMSYVGIIAANTGEINKLEFNRENQCGVAKFATTEEINSGSKMVGTGPYLAEKFDKSETVRLTQNPSYWGEKPDWQTVEIKTISNNGARIAGLLAGDYDVIEGVSTKNLRWLQERGDFEWTVIPSLRVIFLQLDVDRDQSPGVSSSKGDNPLKNPLVRKAISLAIDRNAIVKFILEGEGVAANQFAPEFLEGALTDAPDIKYNPKKAKQLLAEAGYGDGFKLAFHATNDRYLYDSKVSQAIAQYLKKVGIDVELHSMTKTVFFSKRRSKEYSFSMGGWASGSGPVSLLKSFAATRNKEKGYGSGNYGGYSNPEFDVVLDKALTTMDRSTRVGYQQEATRMILDDLPLIPLHWQKYSWAYKDHIKTEGRTDEKTIAMEFHKK